MKLKLTEARRVKVGQVLAECRGMNRYSKIKSLTRSDLFSPRLSWKQAASLLGQMPRKRQRRGLNAVNHDQARYERMMERADLK